ncbi:MAG: cell division protein FtsZ, partial [Gammaproteobacteria bacterium HGW-Gammaproteobacteria-6]
ADMVFITAGMGGGTGTGAAPVVAQLAKEMGILTVAVVTKPFPFEGRRRMQVALKGIEELSQHCDSLITVPNEKLITVLGREATMVQAFRAANDVLLGAVQGIADLIVRPGMINVDFADVRTVMSEMGMAMMGTGTGRGESRALDAADAAVSNPLLEDISLAGACGVLVNITAGPDFTMREFDEIGRTIEEFASEDATVVIGTSLDPDMQDEVRVTVVATGLNRGAVRQPVRTSEREPVVQPRPIKLVRNGSTGAIENADDYNPGLTGNGLRASARNDAAASMEPAVDHSYLDIPAFLRRQAD